MSQPLSFLQVDRNALRHNVSTFRERISAHRALIAVVKGNAYGHGLGEVVTCVDDLVDGYQVDDIEELRTLRSLTQKRILVLGYVQPDDLPEAVTLDSELVVYDLDNLRLLQSLPASKVHLKLDVLLGRQGVLPHDLGAFLQNWDGSKGPNLLGVYTHFSNLEDTPSRSHAEAQIAGFEEAIRQIQSWSPDPVPTHLSSTAAILAYEGKASTRSLVRLGIGLYGLHPSPQDASSIDLKPALRWVSHLAQVKTLPAGHPVGYGLTYVTWKPTCIGIVPQGYSDGYDRGLSNKGRVLIRGKRCPVLGRVAMNMFAVDLSLVPDVQAMEEVVLLGSQGSECLRAEELAGFLDTIHYEVVTRISPLLPRIVI